VRILVDVNLAPAWTTVLSDHGFEAEHWTHIGDPRATDATVMQWARDHGYVVFTHDLDFGALLALTRLQGPSVVQVRTQDVSPAHLASIVVAGLLHHADALERGALVTIDEARARVRILPIRSED
jgi:predicted nuclease of predicted toxin-antitoxin system